MSRSQWACLVAGLLLAACRTVPMLPDDTLAALKASPEAYLEGEVKGLSSLAVLNDSDFVYTAAFSPDSQRVAGVTLGARAYTLQLFEVPESADPADFVRRDGEIAPAVGVPVNSYEFDVESIDFSPDGTKLVTSGRDGAVRLFDVKTGSLLKAAQLEEPLSSVAFHPSGRYVVAGSAEGMLTVLEVPGLRFSNELRAHKGEVRGLAFAADGTLYTGAWDKTIARFGVVEEPVGAQRARTSFENKGASPLVRGTLDDSVVLSFALDAREAHIIVKSEVARLAGIDLGALTDSVQVPTAMGQMSARIARGRTLTFKGLQLSNVDVVVCDACVPPEAQGVLGEAFLSRVEVAFEPEAKVAVLTLKEGVEAGERKGLSLKESARHTFEWFVNDLTLDAKGERLGVAFSEVPAQRTQEIYKREKEGRVEPLAQGNAGAIVDARSGTILRQWALHRGVVSTAAISPDGGTLLSGGWDNRLRVLSFAEEGDRPVAVMKYGWSVRRARFSPNGRFVVVAAWTPQNPVGDYSSDPALQLFTVQYGESVRAEKRGQATFPVPEK